MRELIGLIRRESLRPWKLFTFSIGLLLLIAGSFYYQAPDWDIPVSVIMATFTYLTAGWSMRVILERLWRHWPLMLFFTWWAVDGSYALYWHFVDPVVLGLMREANAPASLSLYLACGLVWCFDGTVKEAAQILFGKGCNESNK